jgi:ankyrin repeat protein
MRKHVKYFVYLILLFELTCARAGSYEEFFAAITRDDARAVSTLLERGFDPNTANPQGQFGLVLALRVPAPNVIDVLLTAPAVNVEVRTEKDESPLMLAALFGFKEVCIKLIARDADINKPGWTPLHYAATGGHTEIMQMLLDKYAYIDASSPNGTTPLMMAAMYSTPAAVKLLLDAGADTSIKNSLGLTALDFASKAKHAESVAIIAGVIRLRSKTGHW